jgi:hypothetical protein
MFETTSENVTRFLWPGPYRVGLYRRTPWEISMQDLVYIALTALLSLLTWGVIALCRSLKEMS